MQECSREEPSPAESGSGRKDVEVPLGADFGKIILQKMLGNTVCYFQAKRCKMMSIEIR